MRSKGRMLKQLRSIADAANYPSFRLYLHVSQYCVFIPEHLIYAEKIILWPQCLNHDMRVYNQASHKQRELQKHKTIIRQFAQVKYQSTENNKINAVKCTRRGRVKKPQIGHRAKQSLYEKCQQNVKRNCIYATRQIYQEITQLFHLQAKGDKSEQGKKWQSCNA